MFTKLLQWYWDWRMDRAMNKLIKSAKKAGASPEDMINAVIHQVAVVRQEMDGINGKEES